MSYKIAVAIVFATLIVASFAQSQQDSQGQDNDDQGRGRRDPLSSPTSDDWTSFAGGLDGARFRRDVHGINSGNAHLIRQRWNISLAGDVTATPAIYNGRLYFSDWSGDIYCLNAQNGAIVWKRHLSEYTGLANSAARAGPAFYKGSLLLGDFSSANFFRVNAANGDLIWNTKLSDYIYALVSQSAVAADDAVYIGLSSSEEQATASNPENCCGFAASFFKLDFATGAVVWETPMIPAEIAGVGAYSGAAIWGGMPSLDDRHVYIATGNLYEATDEANACQAAALARNETEANCVDQRVLFDAIVKMRRSDGAVVGSYRSSEWDSWTFLCGLPAFGVPRTIYCPPGPNPDIDFGQGVVLAGGIAAVGAKSGIFYGLHKHNMSLAYATPVGTQGVGGGLIYGFGVGTYPNQRHKYIAVLSEANSQNRNITLITNQTVNVGFFSGVDMETGRILWQTVSPSGGRASAAAAIINDVAIVSISRAPGAIYALNVNTGAVLWSTFSGSAIYSGAALDIDRNQFCLGLGYSRLAAGQGPGKRLVCYGL